VRRAADALGVLRVVLFAPEDVAIVRGDPGERRRFLDDLLAQRRPAFAAARGEYERALRQRNQLLKQARGLSASAREAATATLDVWTEQLVQHGTQLVAARIAAVRTLAAPVDRFYRDLADRPEPIGLTYRSSAGDVDDDGGRVPDPAPIAAALRAPSPRSPTTSGARGDARRPAPRRPRADDRHAPRSRLLQPGGGWSLALALKLATYEVLAEVGDRPIVLLDDVFAELDTTRRTRLAAACDRFDQVLVTAAVEEDVPLAGDRIDVHISDGRSHLSPRVRGAA
jgi:DNA replication and repair protein RecF